MHFTSAISDGLILSPQFHFIDGFVNKKFFKVKGNKLKIKKRLIELVVENSHKLLEDFKKIENGLNTKDAIPRLEFIATFPDTDDQNAMWYISFKFFDKEKRITDLCEIIDSMINN